MKTGHFKIVCAECGCEDVVLSDYHNDYEEGKRLRCKGCGAKEDL
jgi:DNA-directed RNA polymerase subunit RPC12/RpoP